MPEYFELTVDKFTFQVARDRWYSAEGVWAQEDGGLVRVGLSDFVQQRSGDVAFAEVKPAGELLSAGDELAVIETIKVNIALGAPLSGRVQAANPEMALAPELINQDPYGAGWLALIEPADWAADRARLLDAAAYYARIQVEARQERS
ncbi:MAG: glycine cleavage system protein H [Chloroflexota bacterium]